MHAPRALTQTEYATLTALSPVRTWLAILGDYGVIIAVAALALAVPHPGIMALAVLFIARQQHAMAIMIHEGVHHRLFGSRRLNDMVARWLLAGPLLVSYEGYRRTHLNHHRHTMTTDDPDLKFVSAFPISKRKFLASILPDFVGITQAFILLHYARIGLRESGSIRQFALSVLPCMTAHGSAFGFLAATGQLSVYLLYWIIPMFCLLPFFLHLRGVFEHGGQRPHPNPMKCTWTVLNRTQAFLLAPHHINFHVEHHGYPAIPHFNLPLLHELLKQRDALPMENVCFSYRTILAKLLVPK